MVRPTKLYWKLARHILWYLKGTIQYGLWYRQTEGVKLCGFIDVDLVGSPFDQKSTSGGIFSAGSTTISWYNRRHRFVVLNSGEVEYMTASQATCEVIYMRNILVGLFGQEMDPTMIYSDNQFYIKIYENLVFHDRSKNIYTQYNHLRNYVQRRIMFLVHSNRRKIC